MSNSLQHPTVPAQNIVSAITIGSLITSGALLLLLLIGRFAFHMVSFEYALYTCLATVSYLLVVGMLIRKHFYKSASWLLLCLYTLIACIILGSWGIHAPIGILIFALVIFLSGVMLRALTIIPVTIAIIVLLTILQSLDVIGAIHPDYSHIAAHPTYNDVFAYGTVFGIFALIAWMAGHHMEIALTKTLQAEKALEKEKRLLATRLKEQTISLRESQLEETRQLYHFAELGQLTTVILHELANSLSVLTLDIDDLKHRHRHSKELARVQESIHYLETLVGKARKQIKDNNNPERFNVFPVIKEVTSALRPKALRSHVSLEIFSASSRRSFYVIGDPVRLSQCLTILINNAIDSYQPTHEQHRASVLVNVTVQQHTLHISIIDKGVGIPAERRDKLFEPFKSTKQNGMGIGLFITRQIIETHFKGKISLNPRLDQTEFIVSLKEHEG